MESALTRETKLLLLSVLLATTAQGMALPYLFIYLTHVRHIDPTWAGLIGGWLGLAGLIAAGPIGSLADRFGSRIVYVAIVIVYAVGVAGYAGVHGVWEGFLAATLASVGGPPLFGVYNTLLASAAPVRDQQRLFALGFATLNLGIGLGDVLGGLIANEHHPATFQLLYLIDGAGLVLGAAMVAPMRGLGRRLAHPDGGPRPHGGYRAVLADRVFRRVLVVSVLLMSVAYGQLEFAFPAFASDVGGLSTRVIAWVFAVNCLTIVAIQIGVAKRIEGRSRSRVLSVVALLIGGSWAILAIATSGHHHGITVPVIGAVVFAFLFACGEVLMSPTLPALTNALAHDAVRGRYNALSSMTIGVTSVIGPIVSGPLIGNGYWPVWLALVLAAALACAALSRSLGRHLTAAQDGILGSVPEPSAPVPI